MNLAADSSVLASFFIRKDEFREQGWAVLEAIKGGEHRIFASCLASVEVCGVIARVVGVGEAKKAQKVLGLLEKGGIIRFVELSKERQRRSENLAIALKLRGADAIILEVAEAGKIPLLTFDLEVAKKAAGVTRILTNADFLTPATEPNPKMQK